MKPLLLRLYWMLTRAYLRLRGAEVGRGVKCNGFPYVKIRKGGRLIISDGVQINASRWGNAHVMAGSMTLFVNGGAELRIGRNSGISGSRIVAMERIEIGRGCLIGGGCLICDSDMHEIPLGSENSVRTAPIRLGDRVFLGAESLILKGVSIPDEMVVGAGSVVIRSPDQGSIAVGNPAKTIR